MLGDKTDMVRSMAISRDAIRRLALDVLVFGEIGMSESVYFLSFSRLARRSIVFWGHAITSGVFDFSTVSSNSSLNWNNRGGPDYFVSSELFERKRRPQDRYTERLILMEVW